MNCIPQLSELCICGFEMAMREMLDINSPLVAAIARDCTGDVIKMDVVWNGREEAWVYKLTILGSDGGNELGDSDGDDRGNGIGSFDFRSVHGILSEMAKLPDFKHISVMDFEWTLTEPDQKFIGIVLIEMPAPREAPHEAPTQVPHFQLRDFDTSTE